MIRQIPIPGKRLLKKSPGPNSKNPQRRLSRPFGANTYFARDDLEPEVEKVIFVKTKNSDQNQRQPAGSSKLGAVARAKH